ncbi:snRNA-activating protein complex subunit 4 [Pholidichthys leucotaenia]
MSRSLSAKRDRIQKEVEELEKSLSVTHTELELLSTDTDEESDDEDLDGAVGPSAAGLLAKREKVQEEIKSLENILGSHSPICVSDDEDEEDDNSSEESDLALPQSVDSCLQLNLVYQQVVQETLRQLETLLAQNQKEQKEILSQLAGRTTSTFKEKPTNSSYREPTKLYLGHFFTPYFKDKSTRLGPPANQEAKEKADRMTGTLDAKKLKVKQWESWQKLLLINAVSRDTLRRLTHPKLSRVDFLSRKLSLADETTKQQLREQIDGLEKEIDLLKMKQGEELIGDRNEEYDWEKISNIDFEGTRGASDIRCFWQNFLHPSINKAPWSKAEVQRLKEISERHGKRNWDAIAKELGTGRTAFTCLQMFQRRLGSLKRGKWTPAEDEMLRDLVGKMRIGNYIPYTQISYFMEGRVPIQLLYRWCNVLDPSLKKGPWSKEEDQLLIQAVARHGEKNWALIKLEVPGRKPTACRDRYLDCLKAGIRKGGFNKREQKLLLSGLEKYGVGHWAKIAAEIPNRTDAQCMREWRKQFNKAGKKQRTAQILQWGAERCRRTGRAQDSIRTRLKAMGRQIKLMEEEEMTEEEDEDEDEDVAIEYMDSDDEKKERVRIARRAGEVETTKEVEVPEVEVEKEYHVPPIDEWVPTEKPKSSSFLTFHMVALPSSNDEGNPVRSTIVGKFGQSVIVGPPPRLVPWKERHGGGTMMMVSQDQLEKHFLSKANKASTRHSLCQEVNLKLYAAMMPWIGNVLISEKMTVADVLREQAERTKLSSTPLFTLFLHVMNVDVAGCKEVIEQRKKGAVLLTLPPDPPAVEMKNPKTVRAMLQQRKLFKKLHKQNPPNPASQASPLASTPLIRQAVINPASRLTPPPHCLPASPVLLLQNVPPTSSQMFAPSTQILRLPLPASINQTTSSGSAPIHELPVFTPPATFLSVAKRVLIQNTSSPPAPQRLCPSIAVTPVPHTPPSSLTPTFTATTSSSLRQRPHPVFMAKVRVLSSFQNPMSPPPNSTLASSSTYQAAVNADHNYACKCPPSPGPAPEDKSAKTVLTASGDPHRQAEGRKRERAEEEDDDDEEEEEGGAQGDQGVDRTGKRVRRMTPKLKALQKEIQSKVDAKMKKTKSSSAPRQKPSRCSGKKVGLQRRVKPLQPKPVFHLGPSQPVWVMTSTGLVPLVNAPPTHQQGGVMSSVPLQLPVKVNVPQLLPLPPHPSSRFSAPQSCQSNSAPPPAQTSPAAVGVNAARNELQFDRALIFLEPETEVRDWLRGQGGVEVRGAGISLPYLPPNVGSLSTLGRLLKAKDSLMRSSARLLSRGDRPHHPVPKLGPRPDSTTTDPPRHPPPDSTTNQPEPQQEEEEEEETEEEMVAAVRQLIAERFSNNPAYQLLKARFLACFTVPALMATMTPEVDQDCSDHDPEEEEEEEGEEEEDLDVENRRQRSRQRRAKKLLLCDHSETEARHFSGIAGTSRAATDQEKQ